jgi:hypothetical protein
MKPIEPGCKAMIIGLVVHTEDNYKIVDVVGKEWYEDGEGWLCEGDIISQEGFVGISAYNERNLIRIDDPLNEDNPYQVKDKEKSDAT